MSFLLSSHESWAKLISLLDRYKATGGEFRGQPLFTNVNSISAKSIQASDEQILLLNDCISNLCDELQKNSGYLNQKSMPPQLGTPLFRPQLVAQPIPPEPESVVSALTSITEALKRANSQMEQIARFGYFLTFQSIFKDDKLSGVSLTAVDFKSRTFDIGYVPALTQSEINLTSFNKQNKSVGEHRIQAIVLDNSGATSHLKGPLGEAVIGMLKEPFVLFFDGNMQRGAAANSRMIERLSNVMYASYSEMKNPPEIASYLKEKKLIAIPLGTPHKSVIAQLNKLDRLFSQHLSSAVMRGLSPSQIIDKFPLIINNLSEYKTTPETRNVVVDLVNIIAKELVPDDDSSGRQYLGKYIVELLSHPATLSTEKERDVWRNFVDRKPPQSDQLRFLMSSIFKSGAGLYMNRPKSDFKFNEVSLKTDYRPNQERAQQIYMDPEPKKPSQPGQSEPKTNIDREGYPAKFEGKEPLKYKTDRVRLPGKRDEHLKTVRTAIFETDASAEQTVKDIVNALQPGLYAYLAMHRQESMTHLVRSIKTSRDEIFVKQAINMMVSSVEAQFSEVEGKILPRTVPEAEAKGEPDDASTHERRQIGSKWTPRRNR